MPLNDPTHPGEHILCDYLEPLGLSVSEGAKALDIREEELAQIVKCQAPVTSDVAIRLSKAFGGGSIQFWLLMQAHYDIAQAERRAGEIDVKRCVRAA